MTALISWVRTPLAQAAGWALLDSLWEGALIAALLAAILYAVRSPRTRYGVSLLALCAVLASFALTFLDLVARGHATLVAQNTILSGWGTPLPNASALSPRARFSDSLGWLAPLWLAGVLFFSSRHAAGWLEARRLRRAGVVRASEFWQRRLGELRGHLRLTKPVELLESCLTAVPVATGHLRPVILLPIGLLTGLPAGQIEAILLHELAHIHRSDYLVNMVQTSIENLLFYHPLVWWISRVIRAEREHCCDDLAAALSGGARPYALALAALEQSRSVEPALAATGGSLVKRIHRLLFPAERPGFHLAPLVAAGIMVVAAATGLIVWQAKAQDVPVASPYSIWLNEDVVYIITPEERQAFLRLETNEEREKFIEQFWQRRDPTPGTPLNEFKVEHYRRIKYANLHFATAKGIAG